MHYFNLQGSALRLFIHLNMYKSSLQGLMTQITRSSPGPRMDDIFTFFKFSKVAIILENPTLQLIEKTIAS
jgi:hypothetical protein